MMLVVEVLISRLNNQKPAHSICSIDQVWILLHPSIMCRPHQILQPLKPSEHASRHLPLTLCHLAKRGAQEDQLLLAYLVG